MKYLHLALIWFFSGLSFLVGLIAIINSPFAGLCLIALSLILLPPARNFAHAKTGIEIPEKARNAFIVTLLIAAGIFSVLNEAKKAEELAAQQAKELAEKAAVTRKKRADYFNKNSKKSSMPPKQH